jgi:asparagine synthase (glutamine-hydrolysing)
MALLSKGGQNKWLLREAARPFIPPAVYRRTKQPFLAPPAASTRGDPVNDLVQDTLRGTEMPFVDRSSVIRLLDAPPDGEPSTRQALEAVVMALVSLTILDQRYVRHRARASVPA